MVVLIPISITVPLHPSMTTMSPTSKSFSKTMNSPAMISAMRLWAPRPMIRERIPAEAMRVVVLTPQAARHRRMATMKITYLSRLFRSLTEVTIALLPLAKCSRAIWATKLRTHARNRMVMHLIIGGMERNRLLSASLPKLSLLNTELAP